MSTISIRNSCDVFMLVLKKGGGQLKNQHALIKVKVIHLEGKAKEPPIDAAESCRWEFNIIAVSLLTFGNEGFPYISHRLLPSYISAFIPPSPDRKMIP